GSRADSLIPPSSPMLDASTASPVRFDPAAARGDLRKAGWKPAAGSWVPKGAKRPLSIEILSPEEAANPIAYATANAVAAAWRGIGLDVEVTALPATELLGQRLRP